MTDNYFQVEWDPLANKLLHRARQEAAILGHGHVGTEHLLLAAMGYFPLKRFDQFGVDALREAVQAARTDRVPYVAPLTPGSQTPRYKLAIERAMQQAFAQSRAVDCSDIWHGLLADPESEAWDVLRRLGVKSSPDGSHVDLRAIWTVWRIDDNGNVFVVRKGLSKADADKLAAEFESHGHKQTYWVEQDLQDD